MPLPPSFGDGERKRGLPEVPPPITPKPIMPIIPEVEEPLGQKLTEAESRRLKALVAERAKRKIESLRIYQPLPAQQAFLDDTTRIRLLRGSNRSGKTVSSAFEFARFVTGQDPHERCQKTDGRSFAVGKDLAHIGTVIYRKLFRAGAFKIIRDLESKEWRAFRPWDESDATREKEAKPAPPLIPPRFVKTIAWEKKAENIPAFITLVNGWEIHFLSSLGKPPQGQDLDLVWFDEEIFDSEWYAECLARLLDRRGHFFWSATPQASTDRLYDLHLRCEKEDLDFRNGGPKPGAREFKLLLADNKHFSDEDKKALAASYSDREHAVRIEGEFAIESSKVWPEFSVGVHGLDYFDIPDDWTRYAITDPGRQVCATMFLACPPSHSGIAIPGSDGMVFRDDVVMYDELYITNSDAEEYGRRMAQKSAGQIFEAFIIDTHGGRITEMGSGKTVEAQYRASLAKNGVKSNRTGSGFAWGSDDVQGGLEAFRQWLKVRPFGTPKFHIIRDKCPNFVWEIARYRYKRINGIATDEPETRGRVHLQACARYASLYGCSWVEPRRDSVRVSGAIAAYRSKMARLRKASSGGSVVLGPSRGA